MASYEIDIISVEEINGGVEVFASATLDGESVAFGVNGTVEIERFLFINPPLSVPDPNGEEEVITPASYEDGEILDLESSVFYRYDPEAALQSFLGHAVSMTGKSNENMVVGERGSTVTTIFTDDDSGHDGSCYGYNLSDDGSWSAAQTLATAALVANNSTTVGVSRGIGIRYANSHWRLERGMVAFDIGSSAVGTDTISAVTLSYVPNAINIAYPSTSPLPAAIVTSATPASESVYVVGDFDQVGDSISAPTSYSTVLFSAQTVGTYTNHVLDSVGIAYAETNKAGVCTYGLRNSCDITAQPWTPGANSDNYCAPRGGGYTVGGTTDEPKITITHSAGGASTSIKSINGLAQASIKSWNGVDLL